MLNKLHRARNTKQYFVCIRDTICLIRYIRNDTIYLGVLMLMWLRYRVTLSILFSDENGCLVTVYTIQIHTVHVFKYDL